MIAHPFLFAVFPILFLFFRNIGRVLFYETLFPLGIALGLALLLVVSAGLILRDGKKAGIIASSFLVLFFSYGHAYDMMLNWRVGAFLIGRHRYLLPAWGVLFVTSLYFTVKTRKSLRKLTAILNITAFSLLLISLINIGVYVFRAGMEPKYDIRNAQAQKNVAPDSNARRALRDIYYIILDGYGASSTLKEIYGFDNSEFTDYLRGKGFYVAAESRSNYAHTILSLASSLNMEYVNYLGRPAELMGEKIIYEMIKNNKVANFLKSQGYKFIHFSSAHKMTGDNKYADLEYQYGRISEFLKVALETTALKPFINYLIVYDGRERVLRTFSKLGRIHEIEGPKFVFAHIIPPHPPYLFEADGKADLQPKNVIGGNLWARKESYLEQLIFINRKTETLIEEILSGSRIPPLIILQADHGTASSFGPYGMGLMADFPAENMQKERFRILNAYYLPGGGNALLYDSITPVNTFRLTFKYYFNAKLELLDDRSYYSGGDPPFNFIDVTDTANYN